MMMTGVLSSKLGYEAVNAEGAILYHKNPATLSEVFNHAKWVSKRKYKLGNLGYLIALIRSLFPVSLIIGVYKSLAINNFQFIVFKIVYDFGIFWGILELMIFGKKAM